MITILILLHSILLGMYNYNPAQASSSINQVVDEIVNPLAIAVYAIEATLRILARGLYSSKSSYLESEYMNWVDLFVAFSGLFVSVSIFEKFGILRLFRVVLLVKTSKYFIHVNHFVKAMTTSLKHIAFTLLFIASVIFVAAIFALNIWYLPT